MPPRILVIDDAEYIHVLIRCFFADEAVELHSAHSGAEGVQLAQKLMPDLILLDLDMPEMDGFEVCRQLRENPFTMHVPVIFLTASNENSKIIEGLELGATDYVTKPFDADVLVARVRVALRTKARMDLLGSRRVQTFVSSATRQTVGKHRE